ncbi:hypothetical protein [Rhodopseudomonas sp. BR0M22]|uniref:hypothetical protein n=2 Tax=unclassified Rhodopseudomonas TaxID=2638247 RepID=UPI0013E019EC|nr:hypothetical protein [Rhodopseudomonas sp. BR0M22]NEW93670.1 hypothetical protein [Rhodopseudomonas sp. BR0M22]
MFFTLLKAYASWLLISFLAFLAGFAATLIFQKDQAHLFLMSYLYYWDGLLVATAGFGALQFSVATFRQQFHFLIFGILDIKPTSIALVATKLEQLYSFWNKQKIAVPIFVVGGLILYMCGYPMTGVPKYYLWVTSSLMFYAGGLMVAYTIHSLQVFQALEFSIADVDLQDNVNIVELENFSLYLSVLLFTAIGALYLSFRGTLTANFTFEAPSELIGDFAALFVGKDGKYQAVRNLLLYPIVVFLPLALFASFYMKHVIRQIYLFSIKRKVSEIDRLTQPILDSVDLKKSEPAVIEIRKAATELKEKIVENNRVLPVLTLKDSPSIALVIVAILQFLWLNDKEVRRFLDGIIGITN